MENISSANSFELCTSAFRFSDFLHFFAKGFPFFREMENQSLFGIFEMNWGKPVKDRKLIFFWKTGKPYPFNIPNHSFLQDLSVEIMSKEGQ
jgi:hypothetical protein